MDPNTPNNGAEPLTTLDKFNLGFGVLAILFLAGSLILSYLPAATKVPEGLPNNLRMVGMGMMVLYVLTLAYLKRADLMGAASHKHTKSGANIALQIIGVLAILTAVNWYGVRHHNRVDLTENKQYSLSDQTKKIVAGLKEPVNVTLFVKTGDSQSQNLKSLWNEYSYAGDKLKVAIVDVDREPARARAEKITAYGTTVLERGDRKTTITGSQEQDLTSALLKVTQSGQKVIYFLQGHGEASYAKFDKEGLSQAKDALEKQNYKVDTLNLFSTATVPSDAALVVIAGPTKPLQQKELDALSAFIDKGGRVFLSLQPQANANVDAFAKQYGIEVRDDLVLDPKLNFFGDLAAPAVQKFPYHTITQGLQAAYFPATRSVGKLDATPKGVNISPLVETSADAWGETNLKERPVQPSGPDKKGPLQLMMLAEKGKGRLIVSGDTMFLTNAAYQNFSNGDLFLNSLNWMADEENLVSIPPKDNAPKTVNLLPNQYTAVFYGTVLGMPLALLLAAGFIWWRRR